MTDIAKPKSLEINERDIQILAPIAKYEMLIPFHESEKIKKLEEFKNLGLVDKKSFADYEKHQKQFEELSKNRIEALRIQSEEMLKISIVLKKNRAQRIQLQKQNDFNSIKSLDMQYNEIIEYAQNKYGKKKNKNKTIEEKEKILFTNYDSKMNTTIGKYWALTDIKLDTNGNNIEQKITPFSSHGHFDYNSLYSLGNNWNKMYKKRIEIQNKMNKMFVKTKSEIGGSSFHIPHSTDFLNKNVDIIGNKPPELSEYGNFYVFDAKKPIGYCFSEKGKVYSFELNKTVKIGDTPCSIYETPSWLTGDSRKLQIKNIKEIEFQQLPKALQGENLKLAVDAQSQLFNNDNYKNTLTNVLSKARGKDVVKDETTRNSRKEVIKQEDLAKYGIKIAEGPIGMESDKIKQIVKDLKNNQVFKEIVERKTLENKEKTGNTGRDLM